MKSPFRSIRQSLFNEGKLLRYLGYAIGEIALIIIGILFALKINDYNEDRKAQVDFDEYIVQFKEDVRFAISVADQRVEVAENRIRQILMILRVSKGSEIEENELKDFETAFAAFTAFHVSDIRFGHLGQLLNGNLEGAERDKGLLRHAMLLARDLESPLSRLRTTEKLMDASRTTIFKFRAPRVGLEPRIELAYDIESLRNSIEFRYATQQWLAHIEGLRGRYEIVVRHLEDFIAILEQYE